MLVGDSIMLVLMLLIVAGWLGWVLFVLAATPGGLRATPPRPVSCRRCGYNLTGNVSGICPECGLPTPQNAPASRIPRNVREWLQRNL